MTKKGKDSLSRYLRAFAPKFRKLSDREAEEYDQWFLYSGLPLIDNYIENFEKEYGIKLTEKQKEKARDLFYRVMFAKGEFDERYDLGLIGDIFDRVLTKRQKKKIHF